LFLTKEKELLFQVLDKNHEPQLISADVLKRFQLKQAWLINKTPQLIKKTKNTKVSLDRQWVNLGVDNESVPPLTELSVSKDRPEIIATESVLFQNNSDHSIVIERVRSSCGCLVTKSLAGTSVAPGKDCLVPFEASIGMTESYSHSLIIFFHGPDKETQSVRLPVFGNRILGHKRLLVKSVDLGEIAKVTEPYRFAMAESRRDRFEILGFEMVGDDFYEVEVLSKVASKEGLLKYIVGISPKNTLDNASDEVLTLSGTLNIETSSLIQGLVSLGVQGHLSPEPSHAKLNGY